MKPFQLILLAVFSVLALVGLVLFANFGGFGGSGDKVGSVTIWGTLPASAVGDALAQLKASDQSYNGVTYRQVDDLAFTTNLAEALASGAGPDLLLISQEHLASQQGKLAVIPFSVISERDYIDTYLPITELFLSTDGTYGIPYVVDPVVLYYNRTLLSQGGAASVPATWEAVTGFAEQLTRRNGGAIAQAIVPFGVYENVENARAIVSLLLLQAGNPITSVTQGNLHPTLSSGTGTYGATPTQSAVSFYTQFADPAKTVYTWNRSFPSARQAFLSGDLMFYIGFASELPQLRASNPNLDLDMAPIPQPQTANIRATFGRAYAFAIPRASKNPSGALLTAQSLADATRQGAAATAMSMAPAMRSLLTPSATDRYQPIYFREALIANGWLSPSPIATDQIFSTMIGSITSGRMSIAQALQAAEQAIEATLH